ncbi:autophagy-related protein 13 homolog isoform X1 [Nymphalis io]|uniref:autophagy-related protein 13 homolog isoform X1 n=1 Tax=Inachis io TaxID=171585 RepID=UPI0021679AEB|nr:autophagy-related protein 13 homolog isoform X1 [Nymphalis io]XP_050360428.1 autophagy-related protein 13 homolog isoform X1 [Nymphalis io]
MKNYKMASSNTDMQDRLKLFKFTKILTLKVAQIVVQSRQGKKIAHDCNVIKPSDDGPPPSPTSLQWFNLSIPDMPEVNTDTKRVINGEVIEALANVLCIEIFLRTSDGDEMVIELWTVRMAPGCDISISSVSTIYYRMSIMLKSTLSISRITPAYKLSRLQNKESYIISHKIYGGKPNLDLLGEKHKTIKVSELHTPIGTIQIEVVYRTKMTILPEDRKPIEKNVLTTSGGIMIKSDHFPKESPRKYYEKKEIDLSKPLTAGAFVDTVKMKELHDTLSQQLPPEPPMMWILAEKDKMDKKMQLLSLAECVSEAGPDPGCPAAIDSACASAEASVAGCSSGRAGASKAINVPRIRDCNKYTSLMDFPFADGSPMTELASFYQECVAARAAAGAWEPAPERDVLARDVLARQLRAYEDAVPEFDNMLAAMLSDSDHAADMAEGRTRSIGSIAGKKKQI